MKSLLTAVAVLFVALGAQAKPSDSPALVSVLQSNFGDWANQDTDLADVGFNSDLMIRSLYQGAGLQKSYFESGSRSYVIRAMSKCEVLTIRCLVQVLP